MVHRVRIPRRTAKEFASEIRTSWQKAVGSIIETGKLLTTAKKALGHGKWQTMFEVQTNCRSANEPPKC